MRILIAIACTMMIPLAHAEMYKWVDERGKVHYGDKPPAQAKSKKTIQAPPPASADGAKTYQEREQEFKKRRTAAQEAETKAGKDKESQATKQANCDRAKGAVRMFESGERVGQVTAQGERVVMNDADRSKELAQARKDMAEWCN